jgi:nucleoside-diphosphate-sugar epimerase
MVKLNQIEPDIHSKTPEEVHMRVVIIGGSGHVGTYLVPRLVEAGHEVINISRSQRAPYQPHAAWQRVQNVTLDRGAEEAAGSFGVKVNALQPDAVIDMICFTLESARQLVDALFGKVQHFLHCGTIWVHGASQQVPTTEEQPRHPFGEYGIRKAAIETYLLKEARQNGFPASVLHPGHIVGRGWNPVNPAGNFNPQVFVKLAKGEVLELPNLGLETVHHVHADDVAQAFMCAISHWSGAVGESFHVVSPAALTLQGYARMTATWFGKEANLRFLPWEDWKLTVSEQDAASTWDHVAHSPNCSIAKAQRLLGYQPRYSSFQAVTDALGWMVEHGGVRIS